MNSSPRLRSCILIPARLESTRLPRKLLLNETGKSVLQHTYEAACLSQLADRVIVAVDHPELMAEVESFGGQAEMTDPRATSGTDRIAEVARALPDMDIIVNLQADEPLMPPQAIDLLIQSLANHPQTPMATLAAPITQRNRLDDPNCVKVVVNRKNQALYFSRSPLPFARQWNDELLNQEMFLQHIGLYAFRREFLQKFAQMPQGRLEQAESLEQLRVIEAGLPIQVEFVPQPTRGIDTEDDYAAFVSVIGESSASDSSMPNAGQGCSTRHQHQGHPPNSAAKLKGFRQGHVNRAE